MEALVACGYNLTAVRCVAACPVGDKPTCAFDDRDQGKDVVGVHAGLNYSIKACCRHHGIAIAVCAVAGEAGFCTNGIPDWAFGFIEERWLSGGDDRL